MLGSASSALSSDPRIENAEGEHSHEPFEAVDSPRLVSGEDHLGVGLAAEGVAARLEIAAQLAEVVDLAVQRYLQPAIRVDHRLVARRGQIDDGETAVTEANVAIRRAPGPNVVRPAVLQCVALERENLLVDLGAR